MFIASRIIIPRLRFKKKRLPEKTPPSLKKIILEVKKARTKEEALRKAYEAVTKNFRGSEAGTFLEFKKLFWKDHEKTW